MRAYRRIYGAVETSIRSSCTSSVAISTWSLDSLTSMARVRRQPDRSRGALRCASPGAAIINAMHVLIPCLQRAEQASPCCSPTIDNEGGSVKPHKLESLVIVTPTVARRCCIHQQAGRPPDRTQPPGAQR